MSDETPPPPFIGALPLAEVVSRTGLEFLQGMRDGRFPMPPITAIIPIEITEIEHGRIVFRGLPEARFYNPIGSVHGGFTATLLDTAMGCAVHSTLPAGTGYTTLEFKINFVRALRANTGPVTVEGKLINATRQTATSEARLIDEQGRLYAHGTTTCLIFPVEGKPDGGG